MSEWSIKVLKAYMAYPGKDPYKSGCMLVLHESASKAKSMAMGGEYGIEAKYVDMRAKRTPKYDHISDVPKSFKRNSDLPSDVNNFYNEGMA